MAITLKDLNVLVIDDDPVFRNLLRNVLGEKVTVFTVDRPSEAFKKLEKKRIDIIICDFRLPEMSGLKVMDAVKEKNPEIEFIMISAAGDMDTVISALRKGATDFFTKPFTATQIWLALERTKKFRDLHTDLTQYKKKNLLLMEEIEQTIGDEIIGNTPELVAIRKQMEMVARTPDTSVLILGESGTGKELVARGIHNMSSRKNDLFSAVNMSAVPEELFESEFFGHKKGSFTGALADKSGWFEVTDKGSLFFDEIGEMPLSLQVKLLRVLEDRKYTPIGSQREQNYDIRIISATNANLNDLREERKLRLDLFHRLGTFIISLPPLRDRKIDIPVLTRHFLKRLSVKMGKQINTIHKDVFTLMNQYDFPGNIRELKNLVERAVIVCQEDQLLPEHFISIDAGFVLDSKTDQINDTFDLKEIEKNTIVRALKKVNYNKAAASKLLNLEWNALNRRIEKYEIPFSNKPTDSVFENED